MTTVTLAFIGDVMLGRMVSEEIPFRDPESFWGSALPVLRGADAVFANLECAITRHTSPWVRTPKVFHFRAVPQAVNVLRAADVRYVSLANNHILDFEEDGLLETLAQLDAVGIAHAGAGRTLEEAIAPALLEIEGLRIGLFSLTDNEPDFAARSDHAGVFHYDVFLENPEKVALIGRIEALKRSGVDLVVLSAHLGPNMVTEPATRFRTFAQTMAKSGVDLFHGHSAHVFQGVEVCEGRLILHDAGDFLDDYAVDPLLRNDWSFIYLVEVEDGVLRRLKLLPVRLNYARVDLAMGDELIAIRDRMMSLSLKLGTSLVATDQGLELSL